MADYWTISTLNTKDGIGRPDFSTTYTFPLGQNGNQSGKLMSTTDGATSLAFDTNLGFYRQFANGDVLYAVSLAGCNNNGSDSASLRFYSPLAARSDLYYYGYGQSRINTTTSPLVVRASNTPFYILDTAATPIKDDGFTAADLIRFSIIYPAF
jgi:hypothetical protein